MTEVMQRRFTYLNSLLNYVDEDTDGEPKAVSDGVTLAYEATEKGLAPEKKEFGK